MEFERLNSVEIQGPASKRKCQDVFWLLLFILFWIGAGVVGYEAFTTGNPEYLVYPVDSDGHFCGAINADGVDLSDRKYLYFTNPFNQTAPQVCMTECPKKTFIPATLESAICTKTITTNQELVQGWLNHDCAPFVYASRPILFRCLPLNMTEILAIDVVNSASNYATAKKVLDSKDLAAKIIGDFAQTWKWLLAFAGVAWVASMIWLVTIRFHAGIFVWSVVVLVSIAVHGVIAFSYHIWQVARLKIEDAQFVTEGMESEERTFFGLFIASCIFAFIIDIILLFMRKRISIAIKILKEASRAVQAMPLMVFFPIFIFVLMLGLFAVWVVTELYLASARKVPELVLASTSGDFDTDMAKFKYFQWYLLFALFWGTQFLSGINQTTLSGAVVTWYWAIDKRALPSFPILTSLKRVLRYHLGSIALGSLLVAIVQMIRAVLYTVKQQLKQMDQNNKVAQAVLSACQCCFACVEAAVKFINRNAYIEIAMYGYSFCESAKLAFQLLTRNAFRLVAIDLISNFILFLSKVVIVSICGVSAYFWLDYYYQDNPLYYTAPTVFAIMLEAYVVSSLFLFVYEMTIDATFLAFCEDCEKNDGSPEKPYRMSNSLQNLVDLKNVTPTMRDNRVHPMSDKTVKTREGFVNSF